MHWQLHGNRICQCRSLIKYLQQQICIQESPNGLSCSQDLWLGIYVSLHLSERRGSDIEDER